MLDPVGPCKRVSFKNMPFVLVLKPNTESVMAIAILLVQFGCSSEIF